MLPLRLVLGLLLLLTSLQLWAEPISLTVAELSAPAGNSISFVGLRFRQTNNSAVFDKVMYDALGKSFLVNRTQVTSSLEFAGATDFLRSGTMPPRTLSANLSTEALVSVKSIPSGHPIFDLQGIVTMLAWDNLNTLAIPEPAALILLGSGLAVLAALTKQRKRK